MDVRPAKIGPDYEVVPHAIFWRPLEYFTVCIRHDGDDLDTFDAASLCIGNEISFDLRRYRGHPRLTVSLYLSTEISDLDRISAIVDKVIAALLIPATAVGWRRGEAFRYGKLERSKQDRLREPEARVLVLKIAAQQPGRAASTAFLKREAANYIDLSPLDRLPSKSRPNEELWQQIVGNVISHHKVRHGPFAMGYAIKQEDGLSVTEAGMNYLRSIGFLPSEAESAAWSRER